MFNKIIFAHFNLTWGRKFYNFKTTCFSELHGMYLVWNECQFVQVIVLKGIGINRPTSK